MATFFFIVQLDLPIVIIISPVIAPGKMGIGFANSVSIQKRDWGHMNRLSLFHSPYGVNVELIGPDNPFVADLLSSRLA